ncbi:MAG: molybdopterin-dependent oxidoreductase [Streptosporangiales bacterium]|nr:molybdopterin-dependent oxidoreductase [Streptosporangiales bacterium]
MSEHRVVGTSVRRPDLVEKVTGAAQYCVDLTQPGMLHAKVVRSDRAHARITGIDIAAASRAPGVAAVVTGDDLDPLFPRFGHIIADHQVLVRDKVRFYGEPVALVVAGSLTGAADAAELVEVSYVDLPPALTPDEALAHDAPAIHERGYDSGDGSSFVAGVAGESGHPNIAFETTVEWGDVDTGMAEAALVVEGTMHYPMLYAYAMEPYNAVASFSGGHLEIWSTAQHPFMVRDDLARIFGLPLAHVTVRVPYVGGGYGSKSYTKIEPLAAVGAWVTGRPVKLVLDVEESIYTTRVDSAEVRVRSGFAADGRILAREFDIVMNSGAYADNSPLVLEKAVNRCFGPYRVPHLRAHGRSVYTNTAPASSYRGFGAPHGVLAGETNLDRAAEQLGIQPAQLRKTNLVAYGEVFLPGKRGLDADMHADLDLLVDELWRDVENEPYRGIGFALSASDAGAFPVSTATARIHFDGSVTVLSGSTEMGQGSRSVLAQIAAEELGVAPELVQVAQSDTTAASYERTTGASRTTTLVGLALQRACADARAKLRDMAAEVLDTTPTELTDVPGGVRTADGAVVTTTEVIVGWYGARAGDVTGVGTVRKKDTTAQMPPFWEIGVGGVEVEVDPDTGQVTVDRLVTIADVGFAVNPKAVEGQDLGAATQGLGSALYEELVYDGPQPINPNVVDYRVPRAGDMPRHIRTMLVERRDGVGPYGAKGAGEGALNPMAPAVVAAVARAIGRWPDRVPLTPERVWRLMNPDDDGPPPEQTR